MQKFSFQELGMELNVLDSDIDEVFNSLSGEERSLANQKIIEVFGVLYCGLLDPVLVLPNMVDKFREVACQELGLTGGPLASISFSGSMSVN